MPLTSEIQQAIPDHPKKRQIISAYRSLLISEGHAATSMRRVAEKCGMKLGNLQYYFKTNEKLVESFINYWISLEQAGRNRVFEEDDISVETILKWINGAFTHMIGNNFDSAIAISELVSMSNHNELVRLRLVKWYEDEAEYYASMIRRATPHISKRESEDRASVLMAVLEGSVAQLQMKRTVDKRDFSRARKRLQDSARSVLQSEQA